jgi:hypothetical protein
MAACAHKVWSSRGDGAPTDRPSGAGGCKLSASARAPDPRGADGVGKKPLSASPNECISHILRQRERYSLSLLNVILPCRNF